MPADDLTDPAPATTFAHLDATTVLSRPISELGIYPAVDPLASTSRILDPRIVGAGALQHRAGREEDPAALQGPAGHHRDSGYRRASEEDQAHGGARPQGPAFLSQPFHVAEQFTGMPGATSRSTDTVRSFKEIIDGKHDDIPEQAFYMKGGIEEVLEAAEKMKATA